MRLSTRETEISKSCALHRFGSGSIVRIFGSRVDDGRRGGDIDIHVTVVESGRADHRRETEFLTDLAERLGDRKVDLVVWVQGARPSSVDRRALETGVVI